MLSPVFHTGALFPTLIQMVRLLSSVTETLKAFRLKVEKATLQLSINCWCGDDYCCLLREKQAVVLTWEKLGPVPGLGMFYWFGSIGSPTCLGWAALKSEIVVSQSVLVAPGIYAAKLGFMVLAVGLTEILGACALLR